MKHGTQLPLEKCPHCNITRPRLDRQWSIHTQSFCGLGKRFWSVFVCTTCGGLVVVASPIDESADINQIMPSPEEVANELPGRAKTFLSQAIASLHAPSGAVMLTASAVDSMLKDKGYKTGTLNSRIDEAAKNHLITNEMAAWAHEIRLEANDQRHADEGSELPNTEDAKKVIEFANALAQFLYVLPARVERGRRTSTGI